MTEQEELEIERERVSLHRAKLPPRPDDLDKRRGGAWTLSSSAD
jgi:hypothetical protein